MTAILEALVAFLKTFPIVAEWFRKSELEKERKAREAIDKEHEKTAKQGRPSNDFWDERHL